MESLGGVLRGRLTSLNHASWRRSVAYLCSPKLTSAYDRISNEFCSLRSGTHLTGNGSKRQIPRQLTDDMQLMREPWSKIQKTFSTRMLEIVSQRKPISNIALLNERRQPKEESGLVGET